MNIPIYRAQKIDSDEYVEGNIIEDEAIFYIIKNPVITHFHGLQRLTGESEYLYRIDTTTLAIHFPDMIDSQGNKIFASLQEDGKGGDVLNSGYGEVIIAIYEEGMIKFRFEEALPYNHTTIDEIEDEDFLSFYEVWQIRDKLKSEVIGIQE